MNKKEKNKGLGRGLDALFGAPLSEDWMSDEKDGLAVEELRLSEVAPGRMQPRSRMEPEALEALAASIREEGILSPLIVRKTDAGYEIVAGERRYQAAKMIGLETVPAIVRELDDRHALAVGLIENIQRENLNPIEEALGVRRLQEEFGLTHEECAKAIGRSRSATTNLLRLLGLNEEVQAMLARGELEMGHARALLALEGAMQVVAAKRVALEALSVRQTENLVKKMKEGGVRKEPKSRVVIKTRDDERLEEALAHTLGTVVKLSASPKGKGKIVIEFSNLEQLQGIVDRIQR
jgi:ParB family chromosome partitioning protein